VTKGGVLDSEFKNYKTKIVSFLRLSCPHSAGFGFGSVFLSLSMMALATMEKTSGLGRNLPKVLC
jgi:hypothetical protein